MDRRDILAMLRDEIDELRAKNRKSDNRLIRFRQASRALDRMSEIMRELRTGFGPKRLIHDLPALALHASDSENGSLILVDEKAGELVFAEVIGETRDQLPDHRIDQ